MKQIRIPEKKYEFSAKLKSKNFIVHFIYNLEAHHSKF